MRRSLTSFLRTRLAAPQSRHAVSAASSRRWQCRTAAGPLLLLGSTAFATRSYGSTQVCAEAKKAGAVLVWNGEANDPWLSKDQLLKEHPGAYTTARTVNQKFIFEFSMHCSRLCNTELAILQREDGGDDGQAKYKAQALAFLKDEAAGKQRLKPLIANEVKAALKHLGDDGSGKEYQITVLLTTGTVGPHTPEGQGFDIYTFVQPMPTIAPMVDAHARLANRKNPTIKDVQWVRDRQQLEELQKKAGVNEIVMFDEMGNATEGLQTNFFAVTKDGTIQTAPDDRVLAGTVRKVVLEVAKKEGIPLHLECPNIKDFASWESCFIASTSRLVKPIRKLELPESGERKQFPDKGSVTHRVEALVREAMLAHSEPF